MTEPIHIAAIDAGSNAIRLVIARIRAPGEIEKLATARFPVRLGHRAFTERKLEEETLIRAVMAFQHAKKMFDRYKVEKYRAVATAAAREARNRRMLVDWIFGEAEIVLEVIDDAEEARLVRSAVQAKLGSALAPQVILDLGGGSMELSFLEENKTENKVALPVGTVRLMEMFGIDGAMKRREVKKLQSHLLTLLEGAFGKKPDFSKAMVAACGGNAEALALLAPGTTVGGVRTLDLQLLRQRFKELLPLNIEERMKAFHLRQDRAEVIAIAALVFATVGRWFHCSAMLVPGVGIREGILRDLAEEHFRKEIHLDVGATRRLIETARNFAARYDSDLSHAEYVTRLSLSMFDQLRTVHGLGGEERLVLELAGLMHDVGHFVNKKFHHKHGDYLIRNGRLEGFDQRLKEMIGCLVLYHRKHNPDRSDEGYLSFEPSKRRQIRLLTGMLRLAEAMDPEHRQSVKGMILEISKKKVCFKLEIKGPGPALLLEAKQRSKLLEKEIGLKVVFERKGA